MDYGIANNRPFGFVTGPFPASDVTPDNIDQLKGDLTWFDSEGSQSGSHPAKSQPNRMRPIE